MASHLNIAGVSVSLNPFKALKEATASVPALKYATGVTGLAATVAIVLGFVSDIRIAIFGVLIVIALMYLLAIFAQVLANIPGLRWLAGFLVWSIAILFISVLLLVFTSYAFGTPETLSRRLFGEAPPKGAEISVGFGQPLKFEEAVNVISGEYNVTVFFSSSCDQTVKAALVQPNSTKGNNMKDYLEKLRFRIQKAQGGLVNYTVIPQGGSYEIRCQ
jgi:hypothetical protein